MAQPRKDFHGFAECRASGQMVCLLEVDIAQIGQGSRGTPRISGFTERGECPHVKVAGCVDVTRGARDVTLLIDRPGGSAGIANFLKNPGRFTQRPARPWIVAPNLDYIGEIMETTRIASRSDNKRQHARLRSK